MAAKMISHRGQEFISELDFAATRTFRRALVSYSPWSRFYDHSLRKSR